MTSIMVMMILMVISTSMRGDQDDKDDKGRDDFDSDIEILGCRRPSKEPVVEEPQGDGGVTIDSNESSSETEMEGTREMNPNQWYVGEDSSES